MLFFKCPVRLRFCSKAAPAALFFALRSMLACLTLCLLSVSAGAETWRVRAVSVLDGDTVVLDTKQRLRLRGIDAPELPHGSSPGQYYGKESKKILAALVMGRDLLLDREELDTDRYGRLVGSARLMDGRVLNALMVEAGAAFVYSHRTDQDCGLGDRLLALQREAMRQGRGFWPRILALPAPPGAFVGSRSSMRFHAAACTNARKIKPGNRMFFSSLRQAFEAGYAPARECTPWPAR